MSGSILVLGAVALIVLLVGFGFLLGLLRGFRKSLFFTIVFIAVIVVSFIFATALAKSVYSGSTLWKVAKGVLPESMKEGSEAVNSLKEFVRFYIEKNYTEVLDNGMTAGQSIVANDNAMGIIDGLFVMILKVVMLIGSYIILSVIFYILFGLIYMLFLRPRTYVETTTTTDEDGNETVEEKEIKPNKKRLLGGLIGGIKGFVKAMIILIPITFMIGMVAQIEIPKGSSSVNSEARLESGSSNKTLEDLVNACKSYDSSIGKMYFGLDDFVMDKIISYDVKGSNGKKVKVVVSDELKGFIDIYNTINEEIGIDNIKDYDFKNNLNSPEMRKVVESITTNISNSKATTTLLTAVGEEATAIMKGEASKKDADMALLFDELNLKDKDNKWWSDQISQLNDIYTAFADMELNFQAVDTKEYNLLFEKTTSQKFDKFIDEVFNNELLEMLIDGSLKYASKKLPEDLKEVENTIDKVVTDKEVNNELKAFTGFIDVIRGLEFKNGSVDMNSLTMKTLNDVVDTEILINSKIVGKTVTVLLKNAVTDVTYDGETITFDKTMFDDANFSIQTELKSLVEVFTLGFGENCSLNTIQNIGEDAKVDNICLMLESDGLPNSKIANGLFSGLLPIVLSTITPDENYDDVTWKNEYKSLSGVLEEMFARDTKLKDLSSLNFDTFTLAKIDNISKSTKIWLPNAKVITKMLNGLVIPFMEDIEIDGSTITMEYNKDNIIWKNELASIVQIGLWANDTDNDLSNDYDNPVSSITNAFGSTIKVRVLKSLGEEVQDAKQTELLHAFANSAMKKFLGDDILDAKYECPSLANVANILDDNTDEAYLAYGSIELSTIGDKTEGAMPEAQFKKLTNVLSSEVANSKYLRNTLSDKIASDVDKSTWTGEKWSSEMISVDIICQDIDGDSEGNIKLSEISNSMNTLKDSMLVNLQIETKTSLILQDIFADALLSNDMIKEKTDITNWNDEVDGLIPVVRTLEDDTNKVELSKVSNLTEIYTSTIDNLEICTHKSIVLMNTMAKNLSDPMSTPTMKNADDTSAWSSAKWEYEMPRIGEVLKTLANDDDAIVIAEIQDNMDENSEIKKITFQRIEDNIAYSEALENMFAKTLEDSLKDDENSYTFPTPPAFDEDTKFNAWWYAEITGLLNIIYKQMGDDSTLKLSDFNDTETVKVKVMKELYANAIYYTEEDGTMTIVQKRKDYDCNGVEVMQHTNIGVSEYLQYLFKPQLQNVSRRSTTEGTPGYDDYYNFTATYSWDNEMKPILDLFLGTQMTYDAGEDELIALGPDDDVTFGDVFFGLYGIGSILKEGAEPMTGAEAAKRNKTRLSEISSSIDGITYLQFILSPEMKKIMNESYMVTGHTPDDWDNASWIREMNNLDAVGSILITATNPKMADLDFYNLDNSVVGLICSKVKSSYILQSKMAAPLANAGIDCDDVNTSALTGSSSLISYIVNYEWNDDDVNEAYEAVMDTFYNKLDAFKGMKNNYHEINAPYLEFYADEEKTILVCKVDMTDGSSYDANNAPFLTEDGSTPTNAATSYAEYNLMIEALRKANNVNFYGAITEIIDRANDLEVTA